MPESEYHIFEERSDDKIVWHGSVANLQTALLRMLDLKTSMPSHDIFMEFLPSDSAEMTVATKPLQSDSYNAWN